MSIIIRGIKMPSGLAERGLIIRGDGTVYNFIGTAIEGAYAVEVPVSHGRLIDADAIEYTHAIARCIEDGHNWNELCVTADEICDMPTIIEAEKGEGE